MKWSDKAVKAYLGLLAMSSLVLSVIAASKWH